MKIIFIGAGNLATHLATELFNAGNDIVQVYSRTEKSARLLAVQAGAEPITDLKDMTHDADACIVAVKDSAMEMLLPKVCEEHRDMVFMHTAGSMPMSVFEGLADHYGVLYPMQSFSKKRALDFHEIPCFLEWNDSRAEEVIKQLAGCVSDAIYEADSDERKHLHLAAVFASNFVNHCYEMTSQILQKYDLPFDVMLPLVDETASKVHQMKPCDAQTGPAVRYDENVMNMHEKMLEDEPLMKTIYETMSESIHKTATER